MIPERFQPVLDELAPLTRRFRDAGHRLFLVGGTVRDLLLADERSDYDFDATTDARPAQIKACLEGWADAIWTQGERFGTIGALKRGPGGDRTYEITTHRAEAYVDESRKPEVEFADEVTTDLSRRDFTINAMALELTSDTPTLVDPHNGAADLMTRTLRTPLSAETSFSDDPLRMLRAARFIARYNVQPVPELVEAVRALRGRMSIVSAERIRDELDKLICVPHPSAGLWFTIQTGLSDEFLPELSGMQLEQDPIHRHKDVLTHTLAVVENVRRPEPDADGALPFDFRRTRLAALFHDVGKPRTRGYAAGKGVTFHHHDAVGARMTRKRLTELRYSNDDIEAITELVALHLRFHTYAMGWTDAAVRRYVRDAGPLLAELNVLTRCDCTTRNERKAAILAKRMDDLEVRIAELAAKEELAAIRPELDGAQVMELLGIPPGRPVGQALAFLLEIRLEEGMLGEPEVTKRLKMWWRDHDK
jgi:poly(A) polymerase